MESKGCMTVHNLVKIQSAVKSETQNLDQPEQSARHSLTIRKCRHCSVSAVRAILQCLPRITSTVCGKQWFFGKRNCLSELLLASKLRLTQLLCPYGTPTEALGWLAMSPSLKNRGASLLLTNTTCHVDKHRSTASKLELSS